jgi:hypothetical protein
MGGGGSEPVENELGGCEDHQAKIIDGEPKNREGKVDSNPVGEDLGDLGRRVSFDLLVHGEDEVSAALAGLLRRAFQGVEELSQEGLDLCHGSVSSKAGVVEAASRGEASAETAPVKVRPQADPEGLP